MSIVKPYTTSFDNLVSNERILLDTRLLERVFTLPIFTVNGTPLKFCLAFSQSLKDVLLKVVTEPGSVGAWV